jgi:hypothetical protein
MFRLKEESRDPAQISYSHFQADIKDKQK